MVDLTSNDFPAIFPNVSLTVEAMEPNLSHATAAMIAFRRDIADLNQKEAKRKLSIEEERLRKKKFKEHRRNEYKTNEKFRITEIQRNSILPDEYGITLFPYFNNETDAIKVNGYLIPHLDHTADYSLQRLILGLQFVSTHLHSINPRTQELVLRKPNGTFNQKTLSAPSENARQSIRK